MIINKEHLKKHSLIPLNYNMDEVMPFINLCEKKYIIPMLGNELYDIINEEVESGTPSERISTLLVEALWDYLGTCVCYEYLPYSYIHVSEVGLTLGHSENSDSATLQQVTYLQNNLRSNLEARKKYLFNWLSERMQYFPEWDYDPDCGCGPKPTGCCNSGPVNLKPEPLRFLYAPDKVNPDIH